MSASTTAVQKHPAPVAVVTGAARGIGRAVALALAATGATIIVNHKADPEPAEAVCAEIAAAGGTAEAVQADVTSPEQVQAMMQGVFKRFRRIDILVNNAGITRDNHFLMMSQKEWDEVVDVDLDAVFHCTKAAIRIMAGQRRGVIVNIGSGAGLVAMPGQVNYSAAKMGLVGLTKSAAREVGGRGVRVVNVAAGFFKTEMTQTLAPDFVQESFRLTPFGRWGLPEELARLVVFLTTDAGAGFNGHSLVIDGGRNAWEAEFGLA